MNIYQRIILILGAIALVVAIWTTPRVAIIQDSILKSNLSNGAVGVIEPRTATMRAVAVVGATLLVFFAVKSKNKD